MARALRIAAVLAAALLPGGAIAWTGLKLPPPLMLLKYGPPSSQAPTGRVAVIEGVEFHEVGPGCYYQSPVIYSYQGGRAPGPRRVPVPRPLPPARLGSAIGLRTRPLMYRLPFADGWVEVPDRFWVTRESLDVHAAQVLDVALENRAEVEAQARKLVARLEQTGLPIDAISGERWYLSVRLLPVTFSPRRPPADQERERFLRRRLGIRLAPSEEHRIDPWLRR